MPLALVCPNCGTLVTAPESAAGCTGKCFRCGNPVKVPAPPKICVACKQDVSSTKRVKDDAGQYYCEPCFRASKLAAPTSSLVARAASAVSVSLASEPAAPASDELMLKDDITLKRDLPPADDIPLSDDIPLKDDPPRPHRRPPTAPDDAPPASSAPAKIPDVCPNCGQPVLSRKTILCVRCGRDLTKMDNLLKIQAEAGRKSREEVAGVWIGRSIKYALAAFLVACACYGVWVVYTMVAMPANFFPTSREKLVRDFFSYVAQDNPKGFDKAWGIVSIRNKDETQEDLYRTRFKAIAADFKSRYGADWTSKIRIDPLSENVDEEDFVVVRIDKDTYHVSVHPQVTMDVILMNRSNGKQMKEDGKLGFGIDDVEFYERQPPKDRFRKGPSDPVEVRRERPPGLPGLPQGLPVGPADDGE